MQFTRNVHFEIDAEKQQEFRTLFDREVVPMLKKQDGFRGELALINDRKAVGISLWSDERMAEAYQKNTYPKVLKVLEPVIHGTPRVETYNVATSTLNV